MARYLTHPSAASLLRGAIFAGVIGAILFDAFLFVIHRASFPATYQWIASGIVGGHRAYGSTGFVWLGLALHFGIAIAGALGYAYLGQIVGVLGRPLLGGTIFGVVMNGAMDLVVFLKHLSPLPHHVAGIVIGLVAHVVFYGIPIALYVSRYERVLVPYT